MIGRSIYVVVVVLCVGLLWLLWFCVWGCCGCCGSVCGVVLVVIVLYMGVLYSRFYTVLRQGRYVKPRNLGYAPPGNFEIHML